MSSFAYILKHRFLEVRQSPWKSSLSLPQEVQQQTLRGIGIVYKFFFTERLFWLQVLLNVDTPKVRKQWGQNSLSLAH